MEAERKPTKKHPKKQSKRQQKEQQHKIQEHEEQPAQEQLEQQLEQQKQQHQGQDELLPQLQQTQQVNNIFSCLVLNSYNLFIILIYRYINFLSNK